MSFLPDDTVYGVYGLKYAAPISTPVFKGAPYGPCQTNINDTVSFYQLSEAGGGGPSGISTFSTITTSTINANYLTSLVGDISNATFSSIYTNYISSANADIHDMVTSTIFAYEVFIDNQGLTANATELLLNGVPIATTSNISSLADWSFEPAVSTVQMDNNDISGCKNIYAIGGNYSTLSTVNFGAASGSFSSINAPVAYFSSINASTLTVETVISQSTIQVYSTITTVQLAADTISSGQIVTSSINASSGQISSVLASTFGADNISSGQIATGSALASTLGANSISTGVIGCSTINASSGQISSVLASTISANLLSTSTVTTSSITLGAPSSGVLTVDSSNFLTYNGQVITTGASGSAAFWSVFPAVSTVNMNSNSIVGASTVNGVLADFQLITSETNINAKNDLYVGLAASGGVIKQEFATGLSNVFENPLKVGKTNALNAYTGGLEVLGPCQISGGQLGKISLGTAEVLGVNSTRIDIFPTVMTLVSPAAYAVTAGGAGSISAGGALSLAGGGYIEMNTGNTRFINTTSGESALTVNSISGNTLSGGSGNVYIQNLSSINGLAVNSFLNTSTFTTASISSLTTSTINGYAYNAQTVSSITALTGTISSLNIQSIETANFINAQNGIYSTLTASTLRVPFIENVSSILASTITTNTIRVSSIETALIENVSSITVSTINGVVPGSIWRSGIPANGSYYERVNVAVPQNANTQLISQSVVVTSPTARYMIVAQGNTFLSAQNLLFYATIARHTASTGTAALNLSAFTTPTPNTMANAMNLTINNRMWATSSAPAPHPASVVCNVIDTPGVGTWWYSLWVYVTSGTSANQQVHLSIMQVAP